MVLGNFRRHVLGRLAGAVVDEPKKKAEESSPSASESHPREEEAASELGSFLVIDKDVEIPSNATTTTATTAMPQSHSGPVRARLKPGMRLTRCEGCKAARTESPVFGSRLLDLVRPLHCSKCGIPHAALFFSATQRDCATDSTRFCIGREGSRNICPHIRISRAEMMKWKSDPSHGSHTHIISCSEPSCKLYDVRLQFQRGATSDNISIYWTVKPDDNTSGSVWERLDSHVQKIHKALPAMFCPHLQSSPNRLQDTETWAENSLIGQNKLISCLSCRATLFFNPDSHINEGAYHILGAHPVRFTSNCWMTLGDATDRLWIRTLDPDSYGLFEDRHAKHITWCDDRQCLTTFELAQNACMRDVAALFAEQKHPIGGSEEILKMLDIKTQEQMRQIGLLVEL